VGKGGIATASNASNPVSDDMRQFFADVEIVKKNIVVIKQSSKRIADINQQVTTSIIQNIVMMLIVFSFHNVLLLTRLY